MRDVIRHARFLEGVDRHLLKKVGHKVAGDHISAAWLDLKTKASLILALHIKTPLYSASCSSW
jgi:hypothetical protein